MSTEVGKSFGNKVYESSPSGHVQPCTNVLGTEQSDDPFSSYGKSAWGSSRDELAMGWLPYNASYNDRIPSQIS